MKRRLSVEDELAVDELYEENEAESKGNEYDSTYNQIAKANEAEEEQEDLELDSEESEEGEEESLDNETPAEDEILDEDEESSEETDESEFDLSAEAIDLGIDVKEILNRGGEGIYKGLAYAFAKLGEGIADSVEMVEGKVKKHKLALTDLNAEIGSLNKAIEELDQADEVKEIPESVNCTNTKLINALVIENNTNIAENLKALNDFMNVVVNDFNKRLEDEITAVNKLIQMSRDKRIDNAVAYMRTKAFSYMNVNAQMEGYKPNSEYLETQVYKNLLPGNAILICYVPRDDLDGAKEMKEAVNKSKIFIGFDVLNHKTVESINYVDSDQLKKIMGQVEEIYDNCMKHAQFYSRAVKIKGMTQLSLKRYLDYLIASKEKIEIQDSLIDFIYLKVMYMDRTYLKGAMDIHEYALMTCQAAMKFVQENLKRLA